MTGCVARQRTSEFKQQGKYFEDEAKAKPFWSELKELYLGLQENKCVYCERCLYDSVYGNVEMNIEHYRPKQRVDAWPSAYMRQQYVHLAQYSTVRGGGLPGGYWPLAYHPLNLAVSCLRCNLRVKKSFFPISKVRVPPQSVSPQSAVRNLFAYNAEAPDLFYPLSTIDVDDPQECILFRGPFAFPSSHVSARARERARVTIDLLHLNKRSELIQERSRQICTVYLGHLLSKDTDPIKRTEGLRWLNISVLPRSPHSHCARCFLELCEQDSPTAKMYYDEAIKRLEIG